VKIKLKYLFLVLAFTSSLWASEEELFTQQRVQMVQTQIKRRGVTNPSVLQAMLAVKRHLFVRRWDRGSAYRDNPLPIGHGQTISQPYIVALMTELLELSPGDKALEVGTGSGYQAAILAKIVKQVYTIEIVKPLAKKARERLKDLNYKNVKVQTGDGYYGWEEHAPFDVIIVTAAASHIPPPLIKQLKPGGRMVIPVGPQFFVQHLLLVEKQHDGTITQRSMLPVRFVPLTGTH